LIEVSPQYPADAQTRGIEGYVDVTFTVTPRGTVENAEVADSQPARVFDQAALAAVSRWRYPEDSDRAPQTVTRRVAFGLSDYVFELPAPRSASAPPATTAGGTRNQCVREQTVYNYGEMVEVGLMNACRESLLVYSCAEGAGRYPGRWVCMDSEEQQSVLVPAGDGRIGTRASVATPEGPRSFLFDDDFFVARTPNTQYWWLACGVDDAACRADARQWVRSVDKQLASVDPQARASVTVSHSR
jgi:TonB family protein